MKQIIDMCSSVLMILICFFLCFNVIIAVSLRIDADEYKSDVIAEIEDSNFNESVIDYCKTQATANGYTLQITNCCYDEDNNIQMAEVILEYPYKLPLFNITDTKQVRGTAR